MKKLSHLLEKYSNSTESVTENVLNYNQLQTYLKNKGITDPREARRITEKIFAEDKSDYYVSTPGENSIETSDYYVKDVESALQKLNLKGAVERRRPAQNGKVIEMQKSLNTIIPTFGAACQKAAEFTKDKYKEKLKYVGDQYVKSDLKIKEDGILGSETYKMLKRLEEAMRLAIRDLSEFGEDSEEFPDALGLSTNHNVKQLLDSADRIYKATILRTILQSPGSAQSKIKTCAVLAKKLSDEIQALKSMSFAHTEGYPATDIVLGESPKLSSNYSNSVIKLAYFMNNKHLKKKF